MIEGIERQRPLGSGFGARTGAAEVLAGIDLAGRYAVITGGYSGIGLATTSALAGAGADVLVPARRPDRARDALAGVPRASTAALDLGDRSSVAALAGELRAAGRPVDLLICNAGIMAAPLRRIGRWDPQFATNHLGHFALTGALWPLLAAAGDARVVAVSSAGHHNSPIRWDDPAFEREPYDPWLAYGQSKTANALFALELSRRGAADGIGAWSVHPGNIRTPLQRHMSDAEMIERGWIDASGAVVDPSFKTPEQGAATSVWAAVEPRLSERPGAYCEDVEVAEPAGEQPYRGVRSWAADPDAATRLWELSERALA